MLSRAAPSPSAPPAPHRDRASRPHPAAPLRRGVFWRLIEREADWLPPWRELLRVFRRLESRGEIRGGRFVAGFSGEQFALPDAVGLLRETRRRPASGAFVSISGADPLNLVGILTPGLKLAALTGNRLLYRERAADRGAQPAAPCSRWRNSPAPTPGRRRSASSGRRRRGFWPG